MQLGGKAWFTILLAVFAGLMLYRSLGLSPVGRLVPLTVLIPTLAMLLWQLALDLASKPVPTRRGRRRIDFFHSERHRQSVRLPSERVADIAVNTELPGLRERRVIAGLLAFLLSIYLLGFSISVPLFILLYLRKRAGPGVCPWSCSR